MTLEIAGQRSWRRFFTCYVFHGSQEVSPNVFQKSVQYSSILSEMTQISFQLPHFVRTLRNCIVQLIVVCFERFIILWFLQRHFWISPKASPVMKSSIKWHHSRSFHSAITLLQDIGWHPQEIRLKRHYFLTHTDPNTERIPRNHSGLLGNRMQLYATMCPSCILR